MTEESNAQTKIFGFTIRYNKTSETFKIEAGNIDEARETLDKVIKTHPKLKSAKRYTITDETELEGSLFESQMKAAKTRENLESLVNNYMTNLSKSFESGEADKKAYEEGGMVFVRMVNGELKINHCTKSVYQQILNSGGTNLNIVATFTTKEREQSEVRTMVSKSPIQLAMERDTE